MIYVSDQSPAPPTCTIIEEVAAEGGPAAAASVHNPPRTPTVGVSHAENNQTSAPVSTPPHSSRINPSSEQSAVPAAITESDSDEAALDNKVTIVPPPIASRPEKTKSIVSGLECRKGTLD